MSKLILNDNLKAYHAELAEHIKLLQRNTAYVLDDIVNYDGITLKCTTAGTTNTTKPNISSLSVGSTYTDGTCVWTRIDPDKRGIDYWAASTTYALNDQVVYDNKIYKCSTAHTSTSTFDNTKWTEISAGGGGSIDEWISGTSYSSGDLVIKDNVLYKANTTTSTTWIDSEWDIIGTTFNKISTYAQNIVTGVVAPYEMLLQVGDSNYCKPPIDVLKKTGGSANVTLTLENYNNSSAYTGTSDFLKIENSKAKLYNYKEYPITTQTLSTIDIGVSDEIDFNEFTSSGDYGGIDDNTIVMLHFDDSIIDNIGNIPNSSFSVVDTVLYSNGKFDRCLSNGGIRCTDTTNMYQFGDADFTIDFWTKLSTDAFGSAMMYFSDTTDRPGSEHNYRIGISRNFLIISGNYYNTGITTVDDLWHHIAVVRYDDKYYYYFDGNLIISGNVSGNIGNYVAWDINYDKYNNNVINCGIDELRISNIARWTEEFTPPIQPYTRLNYNISSLEVN